MARPTIYTEEIASIICAKVALGSNLRRISKERSMPCEETLYRWRKDFPEFSKNYMEAVEDRAEARNHAIDEIKEKLQKCKIEPAAAAVILKAEIWQAGRENPKRFGDKQQVEHSGEIGWKELVMGSMKKE